MTRYRFLFAVAACAFALTACGSDDAKQSSSTSPPPPPPQQPEPPPALDQPIVVRKPTALDIVVKQFVLAGTASVFEANVNWELIDAHDKVALDGFVTASAGAPERGTFRTVVKLAGVKPGNYELHVFERSAKDGSRRHDVLVPLTVYARAPEQPVGEIPGEVSPNVPEN
jgi:hypothetical protein